MEGGGPEARLLLHMFVDQAVLNVGLLWAEVQNYISTHSSTISTQIASALQSIQPVNAVKYFTLHILQ